MNYLLYGANGYTAKLIIHESLKYGLKPILAGRNREKIEALAQEHRLESRIFDLDDPETISQYLEGVSVCLNAAGPFSKTALPLAKACINTQAHYLDITGEIAVFEDIKKLDGLARGQEVMLMSGTGFDVVPSDCLANYLKEKLPDATSLELAFASVGGAVSHGTASTMLEQLGHGGLVRKNGQIVKVPLMHKSKRVDFGEFSRNMAAIPWGDVSTAFTSTGIPNIIVYTAAPRKFVRWMRFQWLFNPILRLGIVKKLGQKWIDKNIYGPNDQQNQQGKSYLHGIISNDSQQHEAILTCPEGYLLTALASVDIVRRVLDGQYKIGYQTPATAYGWRLILEWGEIVGR